jgi:DNA helicase HerA-like ATPase
MSILVHEIKGNTVGLLFDPTVEQLEIGENLLLKEIGSGEGLLTQIIEFSTFAYPAMTEEQIRHIMELNYSPPGGTIHVYEDTGLFDIENLELCRAKIRQRVKPSGQWENWDGWIPTRNVEVTKVSDEEVYKHCVPDFGNPLTLGKGLSGNEMVIDGRSCEKVNLITSAKGAGKSHLAKVILLELIKKGKSCVVFDINREYAKLPHVVNLIPGDNFHLGVEDFGVDPLVNLLKKFGLPDPSAMNFENTLVRRIAQNRDLRERGTQPEFLTIEGLISMADSNQFYRGPSTEAARAVNGAIASRLTYIQTLGIFAKNSQEATSIEAELKRISDQGGALIIDLAALPTMAREGFVQAVVDAIKQFCKKLSADAEIKLPFIFFEEAHLYVSKYGINDIVTRARHLGITSTFITNMVTDLDEVVLRQVDNLFLLYLPHEADVRHVSKSAITDEETVSAFAQRMKDRHAMVIGGATRGYPVVFKVDELAGIDVAGVTRYAFPEKPATNS